MGKHVHTKAVGNARNGRKVLGPKETWMHGSGYAVTGFDAACRKGVASEKDRRIRDGWGAVSDPQIRLFRQPKCSIADIGHQACGSAALAFRSSASVSHPRRSDSSGMLDR